MFSRLSRRLGELLTAPDEFEVDVQSWHGRLYAYWSRWGEFKTRNYQERFCHYWRVVLIWAPLSWLAFTRVKRMPVLLMIQIAVIIGAGFIPPAGAWSILLLMAMAASFFFFVRPDSSSRIGRGIVIQAKKFFEPFEPFTRRVVHPAVEWFCSKRFGPGVYPLTIVFAAVAIWGAVVLSQHLVLILIWMGLSTGSIVAGLVLVEIGSRILRKRPRPVLNLVMLVMRVVAIKNRRACPPVKFVDRAKSLQ